jgi:hypothetical protein
MSGYNVHITDTTTGEAVVYRYHYSWADGSEYLWSEGNYGCDCNRHIFFEEAKSPGSDAPDRECGNGRFIVQCFADDGTKLYSDDAAKD